MRQADYIATLKWRDGSKVRGYAGSQFDRDVVPVVVETDEGDIVFLGQANHLFGTCDCCKDHFDVKRFAFLFDDQEEEFERMQTKNNSGRG